MDRKGNAVMTIFDAAAIGHLAFKFDGCVNVTDRQARRCLARLVFAIAALVAALAALPLLAGA
jgi:hypothetical protein